MRHSSTSPRWSSKSLSRLPSRHESSHPSRLWSCARPIRSSGRCHSTPERLSQSRRMSAKVTSRTSFDRTARSRCRHHRNRRLACCHKNIHNRLRPSSGSRNVIKPLIWFIWWNRIKTYVSFPPAANPSPAKTNGEKLKQSPSPLSKHTQEKPQYDRPVPGSTLRCLDDPSFPDINSPPSAVASRNIVNPATVEIVDKARDRFDRFWGGSNEDEK